MQPQEFLNHLPLLSSRAGECCGCCGLLGVVVLFFACCNQLGFKRVPIFLVRVWDCKIGQIVTTCSHGFLFKCVEVQQILIHSQSTKFQQTFLVFFLFWVWGNGVMTLHSFGLKGNLTFSHVAWFRCQAGPFCVLLWFLHKVNQCMVYICLFYLQASRKNVNVIDYVYTCPYPLIYRLTVSLGTVD